MFPADLNHRTIQFARFVQALRPGEHVVILTVERGILRWQAQEMPAPIEPIGGLTIVQETPIIEASIISSLEPATPQAPLLDTRDAIGSVVDVPLGTEGAGPPTCP